MAACAEERGSSYGLYIPIVQKRPSSKYEQLLAQCCFFLMAAAVGENNSSNAPGFTAVSWEKTVVASLEFLRLGGHFLL